MPEEKYNKQLPTLLYIGSAIPCRSETFVYQEVFALRGKGWKVYVASVHEPEYQLGDIRLERLADESIRIYSQGFIRLLTHCLLEFIYRPKRVLRTLLYTLKLAVKDKKLSLLQRVKLFFQMFGALSIAEKVTDRGVNHIHAHMAHVPATIALLLSEHLQIPFSFTGHAADLFRDQALLEEKLHQAAFCVCIGKWHRDYYRSLATLEDKRLPIVHCGVDVETFKPIKEPLLACRELKILSVGRLVPKKGFDCLISALSLLPNDNWSCCIVGDGPEGQKLDQLIKKSKHSSRIRLLGKKNHDDVKRLLQKASVFVLPCCISEDGDRDGIPVALMEAMSCGIPVISGNLPSFHELIHHEVNGLLVAPNDSEDLANAIKRIIDSSRLRAELGTAGRKQVVEEFSLERNVEKLQAAFLRCGSYSK